MKKLLVPILCASTFLTLAACSQSQNGPSTPATPISPAFNADGSCSDRVLEDYSALKDVVLKSVSDMGATLTDTTQEGENKRVNIQTAMLDKVKSFRLTYGDFKCERRINSEEVLTLDSSVLTKFLDEQEKQQAAKAALSAQQSTPTGTACPQELAADHVEMQASAKPVAAQMLAVLGRIMQNINEGVSSSDKTKIRALATQVLKISQDFRGKHPGKFNCSLVDSEGKIQNVDSEQTDQQINKIIEQLRQYY